MRIAREGRSFVVAAALIAVASLAAAVWVGGATWWGLAAGLLAVVAAFAFFFRDPTRSVSAPPDAVLAPADGRVIEVVEEIEEEWISGPALKISIFLSLFDVHVNRYPVGGEVRYVEHRAGAFQPAWRAAAGAANERLSVGMRTPSGERVLVRQVAGLVARRIVNPSRPGDRVSAGDRMGIIRFGSRADLFLPPDARADVVVGDRTTGGRTVVARLVPEKRVTEATDAGARVASARTDVPAGEGLGSPRGEGA